MHILFCRYFQYGGEYAKNSTEVGRVFFEGQEAKFASARDALNGGISMIHQELSHIPEMTVAENVYLGREEKIVKWLPFVNKRELNRKTQSLLEEYELAEFIRPEMKMKDLNIAQIQMMEIMKAVSYDKLQPEDMVVMDLEGNKIEGKYKPSSDTATHIELYKKYPEIGGIVHTHFMTGVSNKLILRVPPLT